MKTKTLMAAAFAACVLGAEAVDFEIAIDPQAKPIKDMRQTGCNSGMGFNAALEASWGVSDNDSQDFGIILISRWE